METATRPLTTAPLIRVERGHLTDDELAALTLVLLGRNSAPQSEAAGERVTCAAARWERPERHTAYRFPGSWRS